MKVSHVGHPDLIILCTCHGPIYFYRQAVLIGSRLEATIQWSKWDCGAQAHF